jgi:hypothetical protein
MQYVKHQIPVSAPRQWINPFIPLQTIEKWGCAGLRPRDPHRVTDHSVITGISAGANAGEISDGGRWEMGAQNSELFKGGNSWNLCPELIENKLAKAVDKEEEFAPWRLIDLQRVLFASQAHRGENGTREVGRLEGHRLIHSVILSRHRSMKDWWT